MVAPRATASTRSPQATARRGYSNRRPEMAGEMVGKTGRCYGHLLFCENAVHGADAIFSEVAAARCNDCRKSLLTHD